MKYPNCAVLTGGADLRLLAERQNEGFPAVVDSDGINSGHSAGTPEFSLRFFPVYRLAEGPLSANGH